MNLTQPFTRLAWPVLLFAIGGTVAAQPASNAAGALQVVSPQVNADNTITYRLYAPNAQRVTFTGDFYSASPAMTKDDDGVWTFTSKAMPPGIFGYYFGVDGIRITDPGNLFSLPGAHFLKSYVEVKGDGKQFWSERDVPHGELHELWYKNPALGERHVVVYTPPGYDPAAAKTYPAVYLYSGNNIFDAVNPNLPASGSTAAKRLDPLFQGQFLGLEGASAGVGFRLGDGNHALGKLAEAVKRFIRWLGFGHITTLLVFCFVANLFMAQSADATIIKEKVAKGGRYACAKNVFKSYSSVNVENGMTGPATGSHDFIISKSVGWGVKNFASHICKNDNILSGTNISATIRFLVPLGKLREIFNTFWQNIATCFDSYTNSRRLPVVFNYNLPVAVIPYLKDSAFYGGYFYGGNVSPQFSLGGFFALINSFSRQTGLNLHQITLTRIDVGLEGQDKNREDTQGKHIGELLMEAAQLIISAIIGISLGTYLAKRHRKN